MMLEQLVLRLEDRLVGLGKRLWHNNPLTQLREQVEEIRDELQSRTAELEYCRQVFREVRQRIAENEMQAALLTSRVETYVHVGNQTDAWQHALQLDHVRDSLREDRERAEYLERAIKHHQQRLAQLDRSLATLKEKLY